jgi:hypothetical protein
MKEVKYNIISEEDFKNICKLESTCKIPKKTLRTFSKLIFGSFLLKEELLKEVWIGEDTFRGDKVFIKTKVKERNYASWVDLLEGHSSPPHVSTTFTTDKEKGNNISLTYGLTSDEKDFKQLTKRSANKLRRYLVRTSSKFRHKYNVVMNIDENDNLICGMYFRLNGLEFEVDDLEYINEYGETEYIEDINYFIGEEVYKSSPRTPDIFNKIVGFKY